MKTLLCLLFSACFSLLPPAVIRERLPRSIGTAAQESDDLLLISAASPLPETYAAAHRADLCEIRHTRADGRPAQKMQRRAAEALDRMLDDAAEAGFPDLSVTSAYRSRAYQKALFENALARYRAAGYDEAEALKRTKRYHAAPGESEHESGLAADLHNLDAASPAFAKTPAFSWLAAHAAEYGFILRYPAGKEDITGIGFEPWHFRYVGCLAAAEITDAGLCLEEYLFSRGKKS